MKILKKKWKPVDKRYNGGIICGHLTYNGKLQLLVDEIPDLEFERIGDYFYGEKEGYCNVYQYQKGTTNSFGGRTITLKIKGCGEIDFKGSLWDPHSCPNNIPQHRHVSITTLTDVFERGFTFQSGKITKKLFDKITKKLKAEIIIKPF